MNGSFGEVSGGQTGFRTGREPFTLYWKPPAELSRQFIELL
jgi:hypothetical protein